MYRTVNTWTGDLKPKEWTAWTNIGLDSRIHSWSGKSDIVKSDHVTPTPVVLYSGRTHNSADTGNYYSYTMTYDEISSETKCSDFAVYDSKYSGELSDDPRNLTWNIGGYLSLSRFLGQYNELAYSIRKKMADPIVDMGLIGAESLKTVRSFESIAMDLLHVLRFVKHGDVIGAVKVAFGNPNINAIFNRDLKGIRHKRKLKGGYQWVYTGRDGQTRTEAQLRAMHPAKRWLEYSFGIAPVIQDIHDLATLKAGEYKNPTFRYASGIAFNHDEYTKGHLKMVVKCELVDIYARYKQQLGTHVKQVYALAWELIPLSWLIDYAIDIGGMLSMLSSTVGLRHKSTTWSIKLVCRNALVTGGGPAGGNGRFSYSNLMSYDYYERDLIPRIPMPTHPKIFKVLGSRFQQYNLLAFITMAFSGHIDKRVTNLG